MGEIIGVSGSRPDPSKVQAIQDMSPPTDKNALRRFLGMLTYLSPYCSSLSQIIKPMRNLTKDGTEYIWSSTQQHVFEKAKELISNAPTLQYYDMTKPVSLEVDASESGIGGALLQPNDKGELQPVAYTSCTLSDTEQRYAQIEKECLAICHAFGKWDHWLYGKRDITVHTDHLPLETILRKPLNKAPIRLQKMMMRLQRYSFTVKYKKGTSLYLADTLSRAALAHSVSTTVSGYDVFRLDLAEIEESPRLTQTTTQLLQQQTLADPVLSELIILITQGFPTSRESMDVTLHPYWNYRDELTVNNGIIYKGTQCLVPQSMHQTMLSKIHTNHFGLESSTRMAKEVLFWPGMKSAIEDMCQSCSTCAQYGASAPSEPMKSLPIPERPWQLISQDLCTHEGVNYLITVCHYSDWIEADYVENTLSSTIIQKTKSHLARFGIPDTCHTDNGPQFISAEFNDFADEFGLDDMERVPEFIQYRQRFSL